MCSNGTSEEGERPMRYHLRVVRSTGGCVIAVSDTGSREDSPLAGDAQEGGSMRAGLD